MSESEKDFYAVLGLLSVSFAKMEHKLSIILKELIRTDEDLISTMLIEHHSLHQNIELLKKINKYRSFQPTYLAELLSQISAIKSARNDFIHGIWSKPYISDNDIEIICQSHKLKFSEGKIGGNTGPVGKIWQSSESKKYRLAYLKQLTEKVDNIIFAQDNMINKLEEIRFNNYND